MPTQALHSLEQLPDGLTVGDINPVFSNLLGEIRLGKQSSCCTSCRKPFSPIRKPRKEIRLYPICGACAAKCRKGGQLRDGVLAAIEAFHNGEESKQ